MHYLHGREHGMVGRQRGVSALACKFEDLREVPKKYEPATVASISYPNPGELVRLVPGGQHILEGECRVSGRCCLKKSRRIAFEK